MIKNLFNEPKIISLIGDVNTGKSMCLYWIIEKLRKIGTFNLYTYGFREKIENAQEINSVDELEQITNSIIIIDEVMTLWDLDNRMAKRQIENSLRLIHHNNNILVICAVPENIRKFIAGKISVYLFKKVTISDFINGSKAKQVIVSYRGRERGSSILNLPVNEALVFDGLHYSKIKIPYIPKYDTKKNNERIVKVNDFVNKNANKNNGKCK